MRGMSHACAGRVDGHTEALHAAEKWIEQCPETLRLRQVWTILGEAYIQSNKLEDANKLAGKLQQMSLDVHDPRGQGWAAYLEGHVLAHRGQLAEARARLEEAVALSEKGGDLAYQLAAAGRLIATRIQVGDTSAALTLGVQSARRLARAHLRNPSVVVDGVTLAAAALARQHGPLPHDVRATIRTVAKRGRAANAMRYTTPWFLVGKGAWKWASGSQRSGDKLIERGLRLAEERQLLGEQYELHRYLAVLRGSQPQLASQHTAAADRLQAAAH
jgi:tetratricopeptide (TPR) repeat protein